MIRGNVNAGGEFYGRDSNEKGYIPAGPEYPPGAILVASFIGGVLSTPRGKYRLLKPVTKERGMFVYVPIKEV